MVLYIFFVNRDDERVRTLKYILKRERQTDRQTKRDKERQRETKKERERDVERYIRCLLICVQVSGHHTVSTSCPNTSSWTPPARGHYSRVFRGKHIPFITIQM